MRIDWLEISAWKNLRDFRLDLDEKQLTTVLIGANGTGKSNLLEAIVRIFRNLDLGERPDFQYRMRYECRNRLIDIDALPRVGSSDFKKTSRKEMEIKVDGVKIGWADFLKNKDTYLPNNVFAYYSGTKQRLEKLFEKHLRDFYDATLKLDDKVSSKTLPLRRLFYCHHAHSFYVLLAYFAFDDEKSRKFLAEHMQISGIESVLFVLRNPYWFKGKPTDIQLSEGDERFFYARGLVKRFVGRLWEHCLPSINQRDKEVLDFRGRTEERDYLYLFLPDEKALQKFAKKSGSQKEFFKELETTWINDLIGETRIKFRRKNAKDHVTFQDLSEGEQQFLTVLGLLKFTKDDESLFLLDEPDTHLNPLWKYRYLEHLEEVVGSNSKSQMLIATHDPLVLGGLRRNEVRVLVRAPDTGGIKSMAPENDPISMSLSDLLTSELFGLRSTVPIEIVKKLDRRAELVGKGKKRSRKENTELTNLSGELGQFGFAREFRDPYEKAFMAAMARRTEFQRPALTAEQINGQNKLADSIVKELLEEAKK